MMIRTGLQTRVTNYYLRKRAKVEGDIEAIHSENVQPTFMYNVLGKEWVSLHERQFAYKTSTKAHEVSGSCADFQAMFGAGLTQTLCWGVDNLDSAVLRITEGKES